MSRSYKKPWVKDYNPIGKRIHARRYRRYIRQDVKQWRNRYYEGTFPGCVYCECLDEFWDNDAEALYWRACLAYELEPAYDPRNKWIDKYDICDWRIYWVDIDPSIKYLHK